MPIGDSVEWSRNACVFFASIKTTMLFVFDFHWRLGRKNYDNPQLNSCEPCNVIVIIISNYELLMN